MTMFEGKDVHETKITLTGGAKELMDEPPTIDQIVDIHLQGRVSGIDYRVDDSSGNLVKCVRVKIIDIEEVKTVSVPDNISSIQRSQSA